LQHDDDPLTLVQSKRAISVRSKLYLTIAIKSEFT
jgi:hypothetical protein